MRRDNRPSKRSSFRPNLESLEARENPAVNVWLGAADSFATARYWSDGVPTPDDVLVFTATPVTVTLAGKAVLVSGSNQSLTFPTSVLSFTGIRLLNGYAGTVTFPVGISFGEYTQNSGTTAQSSGTVLSVSATFGWTGGTINNTGNAATYKLIGASGQFGEDTTTLSSGSKFVLDNGATATQSGILNILNGQGIDVLAGAALYQQQLINQQNNKPAVNADGTVLTKGEVYDKGGKLPSVKVDGGSLWVQEKGLEVTGKVPGEDWSVVVTTTAGGTVRISSGETLKVAHGLYMNCATGSVYTNWADNGPQTATIEGKFRIDDGTITLGEGRPVPNPNDVLSLVFSGLVVTENAELFGGTFKPQLNPQSSSGCDYIQANKKLDIDAAFKISPEYHVAGPPAYDTSAWPVLVSGQGFTDGTNPTNGDEDHFTMARSDGEDPLTWVVKPKRPE